MPDSHGIFDEALSSLEGMDADARAIADRSIGKGLTELAEAEEAMRVRPAPPALARSRAAR